MPIQEEHQPRRWRESSLCCLPTLVTSYQVFVRHLLELSSTCLFGLVLSLSCTMPVFNSGPAFFKQLSLPPSVALSAFWASQAPRNAAFASKGLASQLGALSLHPVSGGGGPATSLSASAPALCLALATPPPDSAQEEPLVAAPGAPPIAGVVSSFLLQTVISVWGRRNQVPC
jgi:hypothetical protein